MRRIMVMGNVLFLLFITSAFIQTTYSLTVLSGEKKSIPLFV